LNALINISLGLYVRFDSRGWRRALQLVGSVLLMLAPVLLLAGFFYEPPRGAEKTTIAPFGIYATAIGVMLHLISALRRKD